MTSILSIALSGLNAASTRVAAAASNIAGAHTTGAVESSEGAKAYTPVDVVQTTQSPESGLHGTLAQVVDRDPAHDTAYLPNDPHANGDGLVAIPNVDYTREIVDMTVAVNAYKANAAVVRVSNEMSRELLGIVDESA